MWHFHYCFLRPGLKIDTADIYDITATFAIQKFLKALLLLKEEKIKATEAW